MHPAPQKQSVDCHPRDLGSGRAARRWMGGLGYWWCAASLAAMAYGLTDGEDELEPVNTVTGPATSLRAMRAAASCAPLVRGRRGRHHRDCHHCR